MKYVVIFVIFINVAKSQKACHGSDHDPCRCELKNGSGIVDLTSYGIMDNGLPFIADICGPWGENGGQFSYNPCFPFTLTFGSMNPTDGLAVGLMLYDPDPGRVDIGMQNQSTFVNTEHGLEIRYTSADHEYQTIMHLYCNRQATYEDFNVLDIKSYHIFHLYWSSTGICPSPETPGNENSVMANGVVITIVVAVLIVLYVILGIVYKLYSRHNDSHEANDPPLLQNHDLLDDENVTGFERRYGSFEESHASDMQTVAVRRNSF